MPLIKEVTHKDSHSRKRADIELSAEIKPVEEIIVNNSQEAEEIDNDYTKSYQVVRVENQE